MYVYMKLLTFILIDINNNEPTGTKSLSHYNKTKIKF